MASFMRFVNRTSRCFTLYRNNQLENEGINGYQHLYIIKICKNPGISQEQLVREIYVNKSSVTRQLSLLENNGFIRREPCKEDRRQLLVYPTQKAYDIFPKVVKVRDQWNDMLLEDFSEKEKETVFKMMEKIMEKAAYILEHPAEGENKSEKDF